MLGGLFFENTPFIRLCLHQVLAAGNRVAVVGDGKLGLLVAQMLVLQGHSVMHFGKHQHKLGLVSGTQHELVTPDTPDRHAAVRQPALLSLCREASLKIIATGCS